ncbi:threonine synthase [Halovenus salina]|uniref:Pyridoxal-phosphate dependent enzyme n=1 Tax=Halovenus salina TaxID=1510225 RepID=A0ABD5VYW5_9EURY|nr:pyridoxal-phosphate dependent enzyme [Halovenus salina]
METTEGFAGLRCLSCETTTDASAERCPDCDGLLDPVYDEATLERAHERVHNGERAAVLPFDDPVTIGEGGVTLIESPDLATELGVGRVLVADEGHNPTGALVDREMAVAVTAAHEAGAETVALPTTGNGGQAAAAYAARAGLEAECFVPSRSVFANKAMINVHGGEMSVVGGRYSDAAEVFEEASAEEEWRSLAPFGTPYRHEGAKTLAYDLLAELDDAPDAVVHPTSHGTGLYGLAKGFREFTETDHLGDVPRLYAAQPEGCAPLVDAGDEPTSVEHPDTICGALEVPAPAGGALALDALAETDGTAVAAEDDDILEGAASLAAAGVPLSATGGAAAAGARNLADDAFDTDETVVLVNPATANREADILRSHLMKQGI